MSDLPYMPIYVADYLGDTRHLSPEQHGAYLLMLLCAWRHGARLRNDPNELARIAGMTLTKWNRVSEPIMRLWEKKDGFIFQKRQVAEYEKALDLLNKKSKAGKESARLRALKEKETPSTPVASVLPTQVQQDAQQKVRSEPTILPSPSPSPESSDPKGSVGADAPPLPGLVDREPPISNQGDGTKEAYEAFVVVAKTCGLIVPRELTKKRRTKLAARLREHGMEAWLTALGKVPACAFLSGENDRGWRADLDFFLQPESFNRVLEGYYDDHAPPKAPARKNGVGWIVTHGCAEFEAWKAHFKRQTSARQFEFRDEPGLEVRVDAQWPPGGRG